MSKNSPLPSPMLQPEAEAALGVFLDTLQAHVVVMGGTKLDVAMLRDLTLVQYYKYFYPNGLELEVLNQVLRLRGRGPT